jgi:hypothetical protein
MATNHGTTDARRCGVDRRRIRGSKCGHGQAQRSGRQQNTGPDVGTRHDQVLAGAGEFSTHLQVGAAKFLIWRKAFNVCSESAGLMAANTHNFKMDFTAVDVDQQHALTI